MHLWTVSNSTIGFWVLSVLTSFVATSGKLDRDDVWTLMQWTGSETGHCVSGSQSSHASGICAFFCKHGSIAKTWATCLFYHASLQLLLGYVCQAGCNQQWQRHCDTASVIFQVGVGAGKAGGFLALDWQDGGATGPLGRLSFKLHQELADSLGQDIGYRRVQTLSAAAAPAKKGHRQANPLLSELNSEFALELAYEASKSSCRES